MPELDRRRLLLGAASAALVSVCRTADGAQPGLREIAASKGLLYGSAIRYSSPIMKAGCVLSDPAYARMAARECGLYVSTNMFWKLVAPTPSLTDLSSVDPVIAWAKARGMAFRGTPLVWHYQTPGWYQALPDRASAIQSLRQRVHTTCARYAGRVQSWDVVNEAILTQGGSGGLRKNVFFEKIGPEYIDIAFSAAREADPKALLTLNENAIEYATPYNWQRRQALLALVDGLRRRNTPLDAIGIQSHLATGFSSHLEERDLAGFLKEISDRGLKIMVTELDVIDRDSPSDLPTRDVEVAALYKRYLDIVLDNPAVVAVITWGLSDRDSWITRGDLKQFRRSDGLSPRPLPFDDQYRPKKAYAAIAAALGAAPSR
jgi:endo-1,4-beta-xylanase